MEIRAIRRWRPVQPIRAVLRASAALVAVVLCVLLWRAARGDSAIFAAVVTASGAIVLAALTRAWTARAAAEMEHRAEVAPIYEELIGEYFSRMTRPWRGEAPGPRRGPTAPITPDEAALADFQDRATQKLLVWGSSTVIIGWVAYQERVRKITPGTSDPWLWLDAFEELVLVLRKDLGHADGPLAPRDLLRTFLSDVDRPRTPTAD